MVTRGPEEADEHVDGGSENIDTDEDVGIEAEEDTMVAATPKELASEAVTLPRMRAP